jgi:hypothetical protein
VQDLSHSCEQRLFNSRVKSGSYHFNLNAELVCTYIRTALFTRWDGSLMNVGVVSSCPLLAGPLLAAYLLHCVYPIFLYYVLYGCLCCAQVAMCKLQDARVPTVHARTVLSEREALTQRHAYKAGGTARPNFVTSFPSTAPRPPPPLSSTAAALVHRRRPRPRPVCVRPPPWSSVGYTTPTRRYTNLAQTHHHCARRGAMLPIRQVRRAVRMDD